MQITPKSFKWFGCKVPFWVASPWILPVIERAPLVDELTPYLHAQIKCLNCLLTELTIPYIIYRITSSHFTASRDCDESTESFSILSVDVFRSISVKAMMIQHQQLLCHILDCAITETDRQFWQGWIIPFFTP